MPSKKSKKGKGNNARGASKRRAEEAAEPEVLVKKKAKGQKKDAVMPAKVPQADSEELVGSDVGDMQLDSRSQAEKTVDNVDGDQQTTAEQAPSEEGNQGEDLKEHAEKSQPARKENLRAGVQRLGKEARQADQEGKPKGLVEERFRDLFYQLLEVTEQDGYIGEMDALIEQHTHYQDETNKAMNNQKLRIEQLKKSLSRLEQIETKALETQKQLGALEEENRKLRSGELTNPLPGVASLGGNADEMEEELKASKLLVDSLKKKDSLVSKFTGLKVQVHESGERYTCHVTCKDIKKLRVSYELEKREDKEWLYHPVAASSKDCWPSGLKSDLCVPESQLPELFSFMQHHLFQLAKPDEASKEKENVVKHQKSALDFGGVFGSKEVINRI